MRDNRDPTLVAVELRARRREGGTLAQAAARVGDVDVPNFGTPEAEARYAALNGHVEATNAAFAPKGKA